MIATPLEEKLPYRSGYKYQLASDVHFSVPCLAKYAGFSNRYLAILEDGVVRIKEGYAWDGASGPTIDTKNTFRGSALHDALYWFMRNGVIPMSFRAVADRILKELCIHDGMWEWRAEKWEAGVKKYGEINASPKKIKKIKYAP